MNIRCSELYPLSGQAHPFIAVLAKTAKDDGYRLMRIGISLLLIWIVLLDGFCQFFELSTIYENKYKTFTITLFENINYCDSYCFKFRMTEVEGAMLGLCPAHPCCSLLFTHGFPFSDLGIPSQSLRTDIQLRTLTAFQSYDVGYYGAPWPLLCGEIR